MKVYLVLKAPIRKVYLALWALLLKGHYLLLVPVYIYLILYSTDIHNTYRMSELRKFKLSFKCTVTPAAFQLVRRTKRI